MKKDLKGYFGLYTIEVLPNRMHPTISSPKRTEINDEGFGYSSKHYIPESVERYKPIMFNRRHYLFVYLNKVVDVDGTKILSNRKQCLLAAKLIAENFIENPNGFECIGYKDGDTTNIRIDNLMWIENDGVDWSMDDNARRILNNKLAKEWAKKFGKK